MRIRTKFAWALIASLLTVSVASATDNCPAGMSCGGSDAAMSGKPKMDPVAFANKRLSELKDKLAITQAEEPAWQAFADKVNDQAKATAALHQKMRAEMQTPGLSTPDRMTKMAEFMKIRSQHMAAMAEVTRRFYNALTPAQQAIFDKMHTMHKGHMHAGQDK